MALFTIENVGVRVSNISHRQVVEGDDDEVSLVVLTCQINPFTAAHAGDLHDFVKRTLFTQQGVEVNGLLAAAAFNLEIRPQQVQLRAAPDQEAPSFVLPECEVSNFKAKRSKKSTAWLLEFTIAVAPASPHQLAQIVDCYLKQRFLSFANTEATLFDDSPRTAPPATAEAATAH